MLCLSTAKGGLELYAHRSCDIIEELGHKCLVVHNKESSIFTSNATENNRISIALKTSLHLLPLIAAYKLARIIDSNQIDIISIHWSRDFNVAVFAKLFSSRNVKLIYTRHMAITRHKNDLYHQFLYSQVDRFIVITKQLMAEATKFLPLVESQIKLLYHGITNINSAPIDCSKFKIVNKSTNYLHIAIFSRIEEGKAQHLLIEAVNALKIKDKEIHVTVIGHVMNYEYYQKLKSLIQRYGLNELFHFHKFVNNASSYMSCFDVIALTTYAETFGLVLIEAMQSGVAVIGSNAGGVPEIINDKVTGLLFNTRDIESLVKKIEYYFDNPESRKEIAIQGKRLVEVNFSEEQHKKTLSDILESL